MRTVRHSLPSLDPPGTLRLRLAFFALWLIDAVAATLFFLVPYATELNPATVWFYGVLGLPGVFLAAGCYAAIVVVVGNALSDPIDDWFVVLVVSLYVALALNNVPLLLFERSPLEIALFHAL